MKALVLLAVFLSSAGIGFAQHSGHNAPSTEIGQSQFAAISEVIVALRSNPDTDWSSVDIDALRAHLVDMDNVVTGANIARASTPSSIEFVIKGDADTAASIKRMVLAHAPQLAREMSWVIEASEIDDGAKMIISTENEAEITMIEGLGFFGLLTIGAHHGQHHEMIARGHSPH